MAASTKGPEDSAQRAKAAAAAPSEPSESKRRLPVGALVSSVRVDYESFEVGTGQVRLPGDQACVFYAGVTYLYDLGWL